MLPDEALERLRALGFSDEDAETLFRHYDDAERRGKRGHGYSRIEWLETLPDLRPSARPQRVVEQEAFERWEGRGALGYLTLAAICAAQIAAPPSAARLIVASECFPTGALGYWVRMLTNAGLVALLTATSPPRLGHPAGGPPIVGTNPLSIGIPDRGGQPVVADVSMGEVTHGEVLAGLATPEELVPFGGAHAHKAFALAVGLQLLVDSLAGESYGAVLLVARPEHDPVSGFRARVSGVRVPGDS